MFRVQQVVTRERRATTRLLLLSEVSLGGGGVSSPRGPELYSLTDKDSAAKLSAGLELGCGRAWRDNPARWRLGKL